MTTFDSIFMAYLYAMSLKFQSEPVIVKTTPDLVGSSISTPDPILLE